nr:protein IQ-DOMAIN 14-like [Ipomoea batatas]
MSPWIGNPSYVGMKCLLDVSCESNKIMKMEREYMNDQFGEKVRGDSSYDRNRFLGGGAVGSDTGWGVQAVHINNIVNGEIVVELGVAFGGRGGGAEVAGGFDVVAEAGDDEVPALSLSIASNLCCIRTKEAFKFSISSCMFAELALSDCCEVDVIFYDVLAFVGPRMKAWSSDADVVDGEEREKTPLKQGKSTASVI